MSKNVKIIIAVLVVVLFFGAMAFVLKSKSPQSSQVSTAPLPSTQQADNTATQPDVSVVPDNSNDAPPAPTGKVDDTVNAIVDGANKEGTAATSDENAAKTATDNNSQAVNDLGAGL